MGLFSRKKKQPATPAQSGRLIIDVRNHTEYRDGHINGAINIPVHELRARIDEVRSLGKPVVTYCSSGKRSEHAAMILSQNEIAVSDGGGFDSLLQKMKSSSL